MIYNRRKGITYMLFAALSFALMFVMVAYAGDLPTIQKVIFRNIVAFIFAMGIIVKDNTEKVKMNRRIVIDLILRSVFGLTAVICNFYAVDHLVLSDANMLANTNPFFAILFSYIFLKEKIKPYQAVSILIAFIGCLFIIKPSFQVFDYGASLVGLAGGMLAGLAYAWLRKLSAHKVPSTYVIAFFSGFSVLVIFPFMIFNYVPMSHEQLAVLLLAGVFATFGQFFVTSAYYNAPARVVSVYAYTQVLFTAVLGYLFFSQMPDLLSIIGYCIIISMAVLMYFRRKSEDEIGG